MAVICIETADVMQVSLSMQAQQARFLYMLSTEDPRVFRLYFETDHAGPKT